jgi:hypothetical protein
MVAETSPALRSGGLGALCFAFERLSAFERALADKIQQSLVLFGSRREELLQFLWS